MTNKEKQPILEGIHSQVISWTSNCDSKASIIMALELALVTVLFSSKYIIDTLESIVTDFFLFWVSGKGTFSFWATLVFLCAVSFCYLLARSLYNFYSTLIARFNSSVRSVIFWGEIAKLEQNEYQKRIKKLNDSSYCTDRVNQIYVCSSICAQKFKYYNKAIEYIKWSFIVLLVFISACLVYNSLSYL